VGRGGRKGSGRTCLYWSSRGDCVAIKQNFLNGLSSKTARFTVTGGIYDY
jgi:hypothetical protein